VVPDVDHGVACTWHWISTQYHELVVGCDVGCVGCAQQIWLPNQPRYDHGRNFNVCLQWAELSQWDQWLEPQAHLKMLVANRSMEGVWYVLYSLHVCVWAHQIRQLCLTIPHSRCVMCVGCFLGGS
jgi:hypothetical protein